MSLTREDVEAVARLARLRLSAAEIDRMTAELAQIVGYVELLNAAPTDDVEPLSHPLDVQNVFRDDVVQPSFPRDTMLATAPHADDECYRVPAVLGE